MEGQDVLEEPQASDAAGLTAVLSATCYLNSFYFMTECLAPTPEFRLSLVIYIHLTDLSYLCFYLDARHLHDDQRDGMEVGD